MPRGEIYYSDKYTDETHEYRHVHLPKVKFENRVGDARILFLVLGNCQTGPQAQTDERGWSEEPWSAAESRMGSLHASRARASHPPLQKTFGKVKRTTSKLPPSWCIIVLSDFSEPSIKYSHFLCDLNQFSKSAAIQAMCVLSRSTMSF